MGEPGASKPAVPGHMATAWVSMPKTGRNFTVTPNQAGEFTGIQCQPSETIDFVIAYEGLAPGTSITACFADGGHSEDKNAGRQLTVDQAGTVSFPFTLSSQNGIFHILLVTGDGDRKMLNVWAGPPPAYTAIPGPSPIATASLPAAAETSSAGK